MKIEYDNLADAMYIRYTTNKISNTVDGDNGIIDYDNNGQLVGIEMLGVKDMFMKNNIDIKIKDRELELV